MTGVDVEHTKALEAAATPGPWRVEYEEREYDGWKYGGSYLPDIMSDGLIDGDKDAAFIAHARTAVPALVAAVERVQALHTPWTNPIGELWCLECTRRYPCPTRRALETP